MRVEVAMMRRVPVSRRRTFRLPSWIRLFLLLALITAEMAGAAAESVFLFFAPSPSKALLPVVMDDVQQDCFVTREICLTTYILDLT